MSKRPLQDIVNFEHTPRSGSHDRFDRFTFSFLRDFHICFDVCSSLSHQWRIRAPLGGSLHSHQMTKAPPVCMSVLYVCMYAHVYVRMCVSAYVCSEAKC